MSDLDERPGEPDDAGEAELRALMEEELKRLRVEDILLQSAVSLINLAGRRLGAVPGTEQERDLAQVEAAIDGLRGLMGVIEHTSPEQAGTLRDALAQLQMAFVQSGGKRTSPAGEPAAADPASPPGGDAGAARRSGRLWVPGDG